MFSSTAAVYGEPERVPITETAPTRPTSPYGASKLAVDTALAEFARMHGIGAVSLRYFNVAGALPAPGGGWLGERHDPETHLIPNILSVATALADGAAAGQLQLFGDDYPTPDGTCVRDYIHVADLARKPTCSRWTPASPGEHRVYNLGSESGFSNREVIEECREVTGLDIPVRVAPRRPGDPACWSPPPSGSGPTWAGGRTGSAGDGRRRVGVRPGEGGRCPRESGPRR